MTSIRLKDQIAIVTGGGRNLGRSYCLEFARRGAAVVVNDNAGEFADEVVAEINSLGGRAVASYESVATEAGGQALTDLACQHFGGVDIVVNNAGIISDSLFEDLSSEEFERVFNVNLWGAVFVTKPAWQVMRKKGYGRIVIASSAAGMFSRQGSANYATSKAGLYGLCKALAYEGAEYGIRVNALLPRGGGGSAMLGGTPIRGMKEAAARFAAGSGEVLTPRRRVGNNVAPLVAYLVSPECSVTGEAFSAGWGWFGRVFVGVSEGWVAPDVDDVTAENVAAHLDEIRRLDAFEVPRHNYDEMRFISDTIRSACAVASSPTPAVPTANE